MADNRLKMKAMANYWQGLGWYAPQAEEIEPSPENNEAIKYSLNQKRKHVRVGKGKFRIRGM